MNAYEIRHAILNEAREMLFEIWEKRCRTVRFNADNASVFVEIEMLPAPTFNEIQDLANKMNAFVSDSK
jgi:hypothetical protein